MLAFFPGRYPVTEVDIHIVNGSLVARLCHGDGVDSSRCRGVVCFLILGDACRELTNAVLEFLDGVIGCELIDLSPLEVRVIALVGGWMAVVAGDDAEVVEPAQILPDGLGITVGGVGNGTPGCWLAESERSREGFSDGGEAAPLLGPTTEESTQQRGWL